jgi:hypothetical protein
MASKSRRSPGLASRQGRRRRKLSPSRPAISESYGAKRLQLVVPQALHDTYRSSQQEWLMDLTTFITVVQDGQNAID